MSIRKKLLIALLSTTVAVAGGASLAACKKDNTDPKPNGPSQTDEIEVSDEAYEIAQANGVTGSKDEWVADLKSAYALDGKDIKSVSANAEGDVVITYADDTTQTVTMAVKIFKVNCKDNISGAPVKDAWFEIGYLGSNSAFTNTDTASNRFAKSDESGVAKFFVTPSAEINYIVKIADVSVLEQELKENAPSSALPADYDASFGKDKYGFPITSLSFNSSKSTEALFNNSANNFYKAQKTKLAYSKSAALPTTVEVKANVYSYVYFNSYVSPVIPNGADSDKIQELNNAANVAASGIYKFTVAPASGVTLYKFNGTLTSAILNENNVPAISEFVTGGTKNAPYDNGANYESGVYTGENSITLNVTKDIASMDSLFGILSTSDCEVTITVERIGDAEEEAPVEVTKVQAPAVINKFEEKPEGTNLTLMTLSGSLEVIRGDDGFYHVGSENGPILLVQLNEALPRVATEAISKLPEVVLPGSTEPMGDAALTFYVREIGKLKAIKNYADAIAKYSAKANSDGVYGVDDTLYDFLHDYSATGQAIGTEPGNPSNWLLPCQYYQPADGMQVSGSGTETDPYILNAGANSVELYGAAYLTFTAADTGIYTFNASAGTIKNTSGFTSAYNEENKLYVCVNEEFGKITLYMSGTGTVTLDVEYVDASNRNIQAEYNDTTQITTGSSDHPALIMPGINNVIISSANDEGIWVNFNSPALIESTEFEFKIYDDTLRIEYNGNVYDWKNTLKLTLVDETTEIKLLLTTKKGANDGVIYGNYLLNIKVPGNELNEGNNSISFKNSSEAYNGILYSFTSLTGGVYTMSVPEDNTSAWILSEDMEDVYIDAINYTFSYAFKVEAGQTVNFLVCGYDAKPYVLKIEEGGIYNDPSPLVLRVARELTIPDNSDGYENTLEINAAGTYTVTLEITDGSTANIEAGYQFGTMPGHIIDLQRTGNVLSAEFTLSESDVTISGGEIRIYLIAKQAESPVEAKLTISLK